MLFASDLLLSLGFSFFAHEVHGLGFNPGHTLPFEQALRHVVASVRTKEDILDNVVILS